MKRSIASGQWMSVGATVVALVAAGATATPVQVVNIDGQSYTAMAMDSGPVPMGAVGPVIDPVPASAHVLAVPTSTWSYGCSATAAGMIFGYYDRNGYTNMYNGSTNGGVAPMTNLGPGIGAPIAGSISLVATIQGFDGLATRGHVDDYWIATNSDGPDPYDGNWTEHTWGTCTADYMGTNQWKWDTNADTNIDFNPDGSTMLLMMNNATALHDYVIPASYGLPQTSLTHGMKLFAESRGYSVNDNYTQRVDTLYPGGFSFDDFMAEIDAGRPTMVQVTGHTMVGVGYDDDASTIYIHDTWNNDLHSMAWGGTYDGRAIQGITVFQMGAASTPEPASLGVGLPRWPA